VTNEDETSAQSGTGHRLLIVDDNRDAAESMAMLLQIWGHEVLCAYDGPSALEISARYRPQVVILDIGLPGMDGYQVASRLRDTPAASNAVLIAITGYGREEDRLRSRLAGFDHHLVKPVGPDALQKLLRSLRVD